MPEYLPADVEAVLTLAHGETDPLLEEMTEHGREQGFPTVGPDAGRVLRLLATLVDAHRIFEFGSGFGYSAAWFLEALPDAGEIVLTDYDADNLAEADSFLGRSPHETTVHLETGDAIESFKHYDGPFDVVLIDHDKEAYVDALTLAAGHVPPGGLVIADNMLAGPVTPASVRAALEGNDADDAVAGVADYITYVRDETDADSVLLPVGSGMLVSQF